MVAWRPSCLIVAENAASSSSGAQQTSLQQSLHVTPPGYDQEHRDVVFHDPVDDSPRFIRHAALRVESYLAVTRETHGVTSW
jgi:hypothetical protein